MTDAILQAHNVAASADRSLGIGAVAPRFSARTTMGDRSLDEYRGRWLVFFSHPADFTPVCTSEFIGFSKAFSKFQALDCDLLALSVDSLFSHVAWVRSIRERFGVTVPFPITEDPSMAIARAYGMINEDAGDSSTVRATFVIDPDGVIRALIWYPMNIGRSVSEILRLVTALKTSDEKVVSTPEGWLPGDDVICTAPLSIAESDVVPEGDRAEDWYFRLRKL